MSERNPLLARYDHQMFSHVGGDKNTTYTDNDPEYIKKQTEIINRANRTVPKSFIAPYHEMHKAPYGNGENDGNSSNRQSEAEKIANNLNTADQTYRDSTRYEYFTDFLYRNGLINRDNETRYTISYVMIDSRNRNKTTTAITSDLEHMDRNSLRFSESLSDDGLSISTSLVFYQTEHNFKVNDRIQLYGIPNNIIKLRTLNDNGNTPFIFTTGSDYLKIMYEGIANISEVLYNGDETGYPWKSSDSADLYITITGFRGTNNTQYIGNIPINTLNKTNRVYLTTPTEPFNPNVIYIKLVEPFNTDDPNEPVYIFTTSYNVQITYLYTEGVPNNLLNAYYPTTPENLYGYHTINRIEKDYFYVPINHRAGSLRRFGGNALQLAKVNEILEGYPNPNNYIINLGKTYNNVAYVSIISSEFPNSQPIINSSNNELVWENLDDGGYKYRVYIPQGNYSIESLTREIEKLIYKTPRVNYDPDTTSYSDHNIILMDVDKDTDVVTFKSFRDAKLIKPFIGTIPTIPLTPQLTDPVSVQLQIEHPFHKLKEGDEIIITNAISYYGISENDLNGCHCITTIIDENTYEITLNNLNLLPIRINTNGGNNVTIRAPNTIRMYFTSQNTIGSVLGFRNPGNINSVTPYGYKVQNNRLYENEIIVKSDTQFTCNPITYSSNNSTNNSTDNYIQNNLINLEGQPYILIQCNELGRLVNNKVINVFGKIQLPRINTKNDRYIKSSSHHPIIYDSYVDMPQIYYDPLQEVYQLTLRFVTESGELYNFDGLDHSFTLKIVTVFDHPKGSSINSLTGIIS